MMDWQQLPNGFLTRVTMDEEELEKKAAALGKKA
jgi:hypothetical protein